MLARTKVIRSLFAAFSLAAAGARGADAPPVAPSPQLVLLGANQDLLGELAFSPDGQLLAVGGWTNEINEWDPAIGKDPRILPGAFMVVAPPWMPGILVWNLRTGAPSRLLRTPAVSAAVLAFHPDGKTLATGGWIPGQADSPVVILDVATGEVQRVLSRYGSPAVTCVRFSADGRLLAAAGEGLSQQAAASGNRGTMREMATGRPALRRTSADPSAMVWDANTGEELACTTRGDRRLFSVAELEEPLPPPPPPGEWRPLFQRILSVSLSPDGGTAAYSVAGQSGNGVLSKSNPRLFVTASLDSRLFQVFPVIGEASCTLFGPSGRHLAAATSVGLLLAGKDMPGPVQLWNTETWDVRSIPLSHAGGPGCLAFSPDGEVLACAARNIITLAATSTGRVLARLHLPSPAVVLGQPALYKRGDPKPGKVRGTKPRPYRVSIGGTGTRSVSFSPRGHLLASGGPDGTVSVWDVRSGTPRAVLLSLAAAQDYLTVTPQGYYAGSFEGPVMAGWQFGETSFPMECYEARFRKPAQVARALSDDGLPTDAPTIAPDRTPPVVLVKFLDSSPTKESDPEPQGVPRHTGGSDAVHLRVVVLPGSETATIRRVDLRVNGRLVREERLRNVKATGWGEGLGVGSLAALGSARPVRPADPPPGDGATPPRGIAVEAELLLLPGERQPILVASAEDDQELRGISHPRLTVRKPVPAPTPGDLYVLAVGANEFPDPQYRLGFADADARDLAALLKAQEGKAFAAVQTKMLLNEEVTPAGVRDGLKWLRERPGPNDVAVLVLSGHAVPGPSFLAADGGTVPWTEVVQSLKACKARQAVAFLDCCRAAGPSAGKVLPDDLVDGLVKRAGVETFVGTRWCDAGSLEDAKAGHGVFAQALMDAVRARAAATEEGEVTLGDLVASIGRAGAVRSSGRQHPWAARPQWFEMSLVLAKGK